MSDPVLIPMWLYERAKASLGSDVVDRIMDEYGAIPVADWDGGIDVEAVKAKVNRG